MSEASMGILHELNWEWLAPFAISIVGLLGRTFDRRHNSDAIGVLWEVSPCLAAALCCYESCSSSGTQKGVLDETM